MSIVHDDFQRLIYSFTISPGVSFDLYTWRVSVARQVPFSGCNNSQPVMTALSAIVSISTSLLHCNSTWILHFFDFFAQMWLSDTMVSLSSYHLSQNVDCFKQKKKMGRGTISEQISYQTRVGSTRTTTKTHWTYGHGGM